MVELLIVIAIVALSVALISAALPDGDAARLEEEGARLTALLEMARAESRVSGAPVVWVPRGAAGATGGGTGATGSADSATDAQGRPVHFRFVGLSAALALPSRWLDERVSAEVVGARVVVLGPAAILPAQRIVLSLDKQRLELSSDGLGPFAVAQAPAATAAAPPDASPR
jgi:general secretion pathway protein H